MTNFNMIVFSLIIVVVIQFGLEPSQILAFGETFCSNTQLI
jgi:hypothetical protein